MIIMISLLVVSLTFLSLRNGNNAMDEVTAKVAAIAEEMQSQQKEKLGGIEKRQVTETNGAVQAKAQDRVALLAYLAPMPLLTFDSSILIDYCVATCRDQDIVLSYVSDSTGEIRGSAYMEGGEIKRLQIDAEEQGNIMKIVDDLKRSKNVFEVTKDVIQDGEVVGKAGLLVSTARMKQQEAKVKADYAALQAETESMFKFLHEGLEEVSGNASTTAIYLLGGTSTIGLAVTVVIISLLVKGIISPLERFLSITDDLADGDLTNRLEIISNDEIGKLGKRLNRFIEKLHDTVCKIKLSSEDVATGANEIAKGNQDLSQRSQEQAASIEEAVASVELISSNIKASAENSEKANEIAQQAVDAATKGGNVVEKTISSMIQVTESSKKISNIINVVNEIAFQTNLLALNAAVEAARAGEQGRGFAVVAGEVRNLAGRSAEAAKEIQALINDSVTKIEVGNKLVEETGQTLNEIITNINNVAATVSKISSSTQEQAFSIGQVNNAVCQMEEVVQQSASLVEEASVTGQNLSNQANEMQRLMTAFNINDNGNNSYRQKASTH